MDHLDSLSTVASPPHLRQLFAADPGRAARYVVEVGDLRIDYSKQRVDDDVLEALFSVARSAGVEARRDAMFAGEHINVSEDRAVMHMALRAPAGVSLTVDGVDVVPEVHAVLDQMGAFATRVRADDRIEHVVNIGIGGSDLGPAMAYQALAAYRHPRIRCSFVSNVDGADIAAVLERCEPESTLFIVGVFKQKPHIFHEPFVRF
jgi:glucose-6-phosphate isomerase